MDNSKSQQIAVIGNKAMLEIAKLIGNDELAEQISGELTQLQSEDHIDDSVFDRWSNGAIDTGLGFKVAPEDFTVKENGEVKQYFTWDEAKKYEKEVLKPHGWRLPTPMEWEMLDAKYAWKADADGFMDYRGENLVEALSLGYGGYVHNGSVDNKASYGSYWSSMANSTSGAYSLRFNSGGTYPRYYNDKYLGFSVRCVTDD